jgi:hypothetical protein
LTEFHLTKAAFKLALIVAKDVSYSNSLVAYLGSLICATIRRFVTFGCCSSQKPRHAQSGLLSLASSAAINANVYAALG